jgi:hypothetical protein
MCEDFRGFPQSIKENCGLPSRSSASFPINYSHPANNSSVFCNMQLKKSLNKPRINETVYEITNKLNK